MASVSKRQQARNERELQNLIQAVPGNNQCADCGARNPGWASWSLGIFLCMRCASIHRKLGTHISKVKSLSMDTWSAEQVEVSNAQAGTQAFIELTSSRA
jgi:Putative GTPase activating protein for Arf